MRIDIKPADFECTLAECPSGLFLKDNMIGLKTEYGPCEAYCDSGEAFWGGAEVKGDVAKVKVIPLQYEVINSQASEE